jgi:hypothetical protein
MSGHETIAIISWETQGNILCLFLIKIEPRGDVLSGVHCVSEKLFSWMSLNSGCTAFVSQQEYNNISIASSSSHG